MDNKSILDRFELLFSDDLRFRDLRRFALDDDINSLFRLLETFSTSQLITATKKLLADPVFDKDCMSRGQIKSKLWLIEELKKLDLNLGTIFLCGGWYATLATMIFENDLDVKKIRSFDLDNNCWKIAEIFNKPWVMKDWQFKSCTQDIHDINYSTHVYNVYRSNGSTCELTDSPDTVINTSCEHIEQEDYDKWYDNVPINTYYILQSNNFPLHEHVRLAEDIDEFVEQSKVNPFYSGTLDLGEFKRFMIIGRKHG